MDGTSPDAMSGPRPGTPWTWLDVAALFARRWRLVLGLPVGAAVVAMVVAFALPSRYTATATFMPDAGTEDRLPAGASALAGQLGISLGGAEPGASARFYSELVGTGTVVRRLLLERFPTDTDSGQSGRGTALASILDRRFSGRPADWDRAERRLRRAIEVTFDTRTNLVYVSVTLGTPQLSAAVANGLVSLLDQFNTTARQSRYRARRVFVEARVAEGLGALRLSEDSLRRFYEVNRLWQQSPQLTFEEGRLRRQVAIAQDVYVTLRREYETARIEEVNNTPRITVVDAAVAPFRRSSPKRKVILVVVLVVGLFVSTMATVTSELFAVARVRDRDGYSRLQQSLAGLRLGLSRLRIRRST